MDFSDALLKTNDLRYGMKSTEATEIIVTAFEAIKEKLDKLELAIKKLEDENKNLRTRIEELEKD